MKNGVHWITFDPLLFMAGDEQRTTYICIFYYIIHAYHVPELVLDENIQ